MRFTTEARRSRRRDVGRAKRAILRFSVLSVSPWSVLLTGGAAAYAMRSAPLGFDREAIERVAPAGAGEGLAGDEGSCA